MSEIVNAVRKIIAQLIRCCALEPIRRRRQHERVGPFAVRLWTPRSPSYGWTDRSTSTNAREKPFRQNKSAPNPGLRDAQYEVVRSVSYAPDVTAKTRRSGVRRRFRGVDRVAAVA